MSSRYNPRRDPDMRAADQTAGCLIALIFLAIFLPLRAAWNASNKVRFYEPLSPDTPLPTERSKSRKDRTATEVLLSMVGGGLGSLGLTQLLLPNGDKALGIILTGGIIALAVCWQVWLTTSATRAIQGRLPLAALHPQTYTVYPQRLKADLVGGEKLVEGLLSLMPRLTFQLVADGAGTRWQVVDSEGGYEPQTVMDTLKSYCGADTQIILEAETDPTLAARLPIYRTHLYFSLANEYVAPLPFLSLLKAYDPLTTITQRMDTLQPDLAERLTYQVMVRVHSPTAQQKGYGRYQQGSVVALSGIPRNLEQGDTGLNDTLIGMKLSSPLYHCFLVVTVESKERKRLEALAQIAADVMQFDLVGHNQLQLGGQSAVIEIDSPVAAASNLSVGFLYGEGDERIDWRNTLMVLSPAEIAALWHLPNETFASPRIQWAGQQVPAELIQAVGQQGIVLGQVKTPGTHGHVGMLLQDRAAHHYILGKINTGKSTFMHNLIMQDIRAGRGVAVIDPDGALVRSILSSLDCRQRDVVLLECGNPAAAPVPLNPFRIPPNMTFDDVRKNVLWALLKIYEDIKDHSRLNLVLGYVLEALMCDFEATPLDVSRLFSHDEYRNHILRLMRHSEYTTQAAQAYIASIGDKSKSKRDEIVDPIINRTGAFLANRALETMTCHPNSLDFIRLVKQRSIVLIDLSSRSVYAEAGGLATLFLSNFFTASQVLGQFLDGSPPRYYVYVDELERVASRTFAELVVQVRKCGLSLVMAHQHYGQIAADVREAIIGNVGTLTVFEVGHHDARQLSPYFEPTITEAELIGLGVHRAAIKTRYQGRSVAPLLIDTLRPPKRATTNFTDKIRQNTAQTQHMLTEAEVRQAIKRRYKPDDSGDNRSATNGNKPDQPPSPKPPPKPRRKVDIEDFE